MYLISGAGVVGKAFEALSSVNTQVPVTYQVKYDRTAIEIFLGSAIILYYVCVYYREAVSIGLGLCWTKLTAAR